MNIKELETLKLWVSGITAVDCASSPWISPQKLKTQINTLKIKLMKFMAET